MIFDCTIIIVLGHHRPHPYKVVDSTDMTDSPASHSLSLLGPPCSLKHSSVEIRLVSNLRMSFKYARKSCMSLTLKQKLEIIKVT